MRSEQSQDDRAVWQVSGGPANRAYADVFLRYGVALIGPGDAGPWRPDRGHEVFEDPFVRRFASELRDGDIVLLRVGMSQIVAIGLVAGDYGYLNQFDDVNGWDLQHARRVRWFPLPSPYRFDQAVFGASPPRFSRVQDPHPDRALPPCSCRQVSLRLPWHPRIAACGRALCRAGGAGRRLRRQCLGSTAWPRDTDTRNKLRDIHRRAATTILFESSGGQVNKIAHLPELRFALGEPEIETTSIDNAANAVEAQAFFIRKAGTDGFFISPKPKLNKVMSDRRASLDFESDVRPALRDLIKNEFERGASIPIELFPTDSGAVRDTPKLVLVLLDPQTEWSATAAVREQIAEWTRTRSGTSRLYPASLIWSLKKPGKELRAKVETWLARRRVRQEIESGTLGTEFSKTDLDEIKTSVKDAEDDARDEVWASYRFIALADKQEEDGLRVIDLGAGHASASETLCGRMIAALKSESLLNESVGAG